MRIYAWARYHAVVTPIHVQSNPFTTLFYPDVTHVRKDTRPSPAFPYCKRRKAGWGLGTRLISEYDNKLEISASREHITVHKSALAERRKQMLISAANSSSGTSPSYTVITVELALNGTGILSIIDSLLLIWRVKNQSGMSCTKKSCMLNLFSECWA